MCDLGSNGGARTSPGEEPEANDFRQGQKSFPEPLFETQDEGPAVLTA